MSTHYAMCKYDDATGSYIPLSDGMAVGFEKLFASYAPYAPESLDDCALDSFQAGVASRDAEIAQLNKEAQEKFSTLAKERDQPRAELAAAMSEIKTLQHNLRMARWERSESELIEQLATEQAKNVKLLDFIARAQVSSGVCCCGEPMDGHSSPMSCGHSPVDMWDHAVGKLLDAPSDDSALEAYVTKAGEKMREKCSSICKDEATDAFADGEAEDWGRAAVMCSELISAIPAVTLDDLKGGA